MNFESHERGRGPYGKVPEVYAYMAVCRETLYKLMESGDLPYHKVRRCRRIAWADVEAYLRRTRHDGRPSSC